MICLKGAPDIMAGNEFRPVGGESEWCVSGSVAHLPNAGDVTCCLMESAGPISVDGGNHRVIQQNSPFPSAQS